MDAQLLRCPLNSSQWAWTVCLLLAHSLRSDTEFAVGMSAAQEKTSMQVGSAPDHLDAALTWLQHCHRFSLREYLVVSFLYP